MADGVRFELTVALPPRRFSSSPFGHPHSLAEVRLDLDDVDVEAFGVVRDLVHRFGGITDDGTDVHQEGGRGGGLCEGDAEPAVQR